MHLCTYALMCHVNHTLLIIIFVKPRLVHYIEGRYTYKLCISSFSFQFKMAIKNTVSFRTFTTDFTDKMP